MRIIDADSHFMEPIDWLDRNYPSLAEQLPTQTVGEYLLRGLTMEFVATVPPEIRPDPMTIMSPPMREFLEGLKDISFAEFAEMAADNVDGPFAQIFAAEGAAEPEERLRFIDGKGIEKQFILPSAGQMPYVLAKQQGDDELARQTLCAYNEWVTERLNGYTERLIPVTLIDLGDLEAALTEIRAVRERGSQVVQIKSDPVDGKSLAHPDFEPLWSLLDDLGMGAMFHLGSSRPKIDGGWANVGDEAANGWMGLMLTFLQWPSVVQTALAGLIYGGVLERHPNVTFFVAEYGISWLPTWLTQMESWIGAQPMYAIDYNLPLRPSEYVQRQVRVSTLNNDRLRPTIDLIPPGIVVFGSDYPHPEGSPDAVERSQGQLEGVDEATREIFFGGAVAASMAL